MLFNAIYTGDLTWELVEQHFDFIPGLYADPDLKTIYECVYLRIKHGEEPYHII